MKLCPDCESQPWSFVMVFVIATVSGFVTWLIMGLSASEPLPRIGAGVAVFVAVGATLLHYVFSCLKRHCTHRHPASPTHPHRHAPHRHQTPVQRQTPAHRHG